jgi:hypothetical protein
MHEVVAHIKEDLRTSCIRLAKPASPGRQRAELGGQLNGDAGPLQQQPHSGAGGQPAEPIPGQPLVALEYRPAEQLKARTCDRNPDVEHLRAVGGQQVTDGAVDDLLERRVIGQRGQAGGKGGQRLVDLIPGTPPPGGLLRTEAGSVPVGPHHPSGGVHTDHRSDADLLPGNQAQDQEDLVNEPLRGVHTERKVARDRLDHKGEAVDGLWSAGLSEAQIPP